MKELAIEEKVKAYDNLIERLKDFQFEYRFSPFSDDIAEKFPELKESEDERIRKEIISMSDTLGRRDWIAWLEKQGEQKPAWSEDDEEMYKKIETAIDSYYAPFSRDAEEMQEWFKNLKNRVLPQPKQEWSKEDERIKNNLLSELTNLSVRKLIEKETEKKYASWLKSLRPQSNWKPNKEQIHILESVIADYDNQGLSFTKDMLCGLYEQLKKLREE